VLLTAAVDFRYNSPGGAASEYSSQKVHKVKLKYAHLYNAKLSSFTFFINY